MYLLVAVCCVVAWVLYLQYQEFGWTGPAGPAVTGCVEEATRRDTGSVKVLSMMEKIVRATVRKVSFVTLILAQVQHSHSRGPFLEMYMHCHSEE